MVVHPKPKLTLLNLTLNHKKGPQRPTRANNFRNNEIEVAEDYDNMHPIPNGLVLIFDDPND